MIQPAVNRSVLCFVNGLQRERCSHFPGPCVWARPQGQESSSTSRSVEQQTALLLTLSALTGGLCGGRGVAALPEGRGLASVQEHLHRLVRHRTYLGSDQRGHHGPLRTRYPVSL